MTLPMFTIYIHKELMDKIENMDELKERMKGSCNEARKRIIKMGFRSMHSNILIDDLSGEVNQITGGDVGGRAHRNGKYMTISLEMLRYPKNLIKVIIHEWAHLWMFNNSAGFKKVVRAYYKELLKDFKKIPYEPNENELNEEEKNIIFEKMKEIWIPTIKRMFRYTENYNDYILHYNYLTINDAKFLPHLRRIYGISKKTFSDVSVGDEIYLDKVNNGWLVGSIKRQDQPNRMSREIMINFDEIMEYLDNNQEEIETQINKSEKSNGRKLTSKELLNGVVREIRYSIQSALDLSARGIGYYNYDSKKHQEFIDKSVKILLPKISKYLRNIVKRPDLDGDVYDKFWASPANESGISYTNEMKRMLNFKRKEEMLHKLKLSSELSGENFNNLREQMKDLVEWSNSYGLSNSDELWATGVEEFMKLPDKHRKSILRMMETTDMRETPNRSMRRTRN
jgi:predicted metal-dependent hydrolase